MTRVKLRWAIALAIVGCISTLCLVLAVRASLGSEAFRLLTYVNYLGMTFGPDLVAKFFEPRGSVSPLTQAAWFDVFLVLTSGLQWCVIGAIIDSVRSKKSK